MDGFDFEKWSDLDDEGRGHQIASVFAINMHTDHPGQAFHAGMLAAAIIGSIKAFEDGLFAVDDLADILSSFVTALSLSSARDEILRRKAREAMHAQKDMLSPKGRALLKAAMHIADRGTASIGSEFLRLLRSSLDSPDVSDGPGEPPEDPKANWLDFFEGFKDDS